MSELRELNVVEHGLEKPWATSHGACFGFASFVHLLRSDCRRRAEAKGTGKLPAEQRPYAKNPELSQLWNPQKKKILLKNFRTVLSISNKPPTIRCTAALDSSWGLKLFLSAPSGAAWTR